MKPFKPRSKVKVIKLLDKEGDRSFIGKVATVLSTPRRKLNEGMYCIQLENGRKDAFWPEELVQA